MSNRLSDESSPYLLQHAENPVDWFPWSEEALQRAQELARPIFLSVGYSACHWCHVMEHESFEDEKIAELLNAEFVSVKVDREERPDLDQIYMNAVQLMTGRGGWPMSVFLTPDLQPFFGGTYWPPRARHGMPGFDQVLAAVLDAWNNRREQAIRQAAEMTRHLQGVSELQPSETQLGPEILGTAVAALERSFDDENGGFGKAPKFPHAMDLQLLLRVWQRTGQERLLEMVTLNLDKMAAGGIYDHLGGGFARYSTDARWLVPHFEKMLYDNALLIGAYLDGYLATGNAEYAWVVRESIDYVLRDMWDSAGGFHSTEDADSEGVEGKFYLWSRAEILEVLGAEKGARFCEVYDATEDGNFEGQVILNLPQSPARFAAQQGLDFESLERELEEGRRKLREVRSTRIRPAKDDKILVSWNGLMVDSLARAAVVLDEPRYLAAAQRAATFLLRELRDERGRLHHSWRHGQARFAGYLDDYVYLLNALVSVYEADGDEAWIDRSVELAVCVLTHFQDRERGGFFYTADDHETLIARNKDVHDSSVPSGNGMAATALIRLGKLTGRSDFIEAAEGTLRFAMTMMEQSPLAAGQLLIAADNLCGPTYEIVLLGDLQQLTGLRRELGQKYLPRRVVACRDANRTSCSEHLRPLLEGKVSQPGVPAVYVCQDFQCQAPAVGSEAIEQLWSTLE